MKLNVTSMSQIQIVPLNSIQWKTYIVYNFECCLKISIKTVLSSDKEIENYNYN